MSQRMAAGFDLFYRLGKDYEKPEFNLHSVDVGGVDVTIRERVEVDKPFCELRRFKRFSDDTDTLQTMLSQPVRSEEHTSELQSPCNLVCRLLLEQKTRH